MTFSGTLVGRVLLVGTLVAVSTSAAADDAIFDIQELTAQGRVVTANFADFDGDRDKDLMIVSLEGIPPEESRTIWVYLQEAGGGFPASPSHSIELPPWSSVYDVADLRDTPGDELVLLRPDRVTILSIASAEVTQWDLPVRGPSTVGASADERGFDRFKLVFDDFGNEPWILVPQIGMVSALSADGIEMAQIEVGRRANYFVVPQSGPFSMESDIQLFLDVPKLDVGDVNGDGNDDIVAATRHEIRVFLRNEDGTFSRRADSAIPLHMVSEQDHIRGSGGVISTFRDIDGDDRLDLMITHVEGSFSDAVTSTYIFRNQGGIWDIDSPDDAFVSKGALGSDLLLDINGDGMLELLRIRQRFSVFEIIEMLLTKEVDSQLLIHRLDGSGHFGNQYWAKKKVSTGISFDSFRPEGFLPPTGIDLNTDGLMDFITSANGKGMAVYLGGGKKPFARRTALQKFPSAGVIRFADFDDDQLLDFVLIDPREAGSLIRIGRNRGILPGSPAKSGSN